MTEISLHGRTASQEKGNALSDRILTFKTWCQLQVLRREYFPIKQEIRIYKNINRNRNICLRDSRYDSLQA